jgi:PLP dependent protein
MDIAGNIQQLKSTLPGNVTLVAVSKTKSNDMIMEAYEAGQRDFGENYVQELTQKSEALPKDIRWHFIGHLQSNKVKYIVPFVYMIHGVDSLKLLKEIDKQSQKHNRVVNCLFQIYIASEETKFGLSFEECDEILSSGVLKDLKNVSLKGFMGMASNTSDTGKVKEEFRSLKNFHDKVSVDHPYLTVLSFGMSADYLTAIECGSNMVRIGSSIFGERNYSSQN